MGTPPQAPRPGGPLHPPLSDRLGGPPPSRTLSPGLLASLLGARVHVTSLVLNSPSLEPAPPGLLSAAPPPRCRSPPLPPPLSLGRPALCYNGNGSHQTHPWSPGPPPVAPGPGPFSLTSISISVFCSLIPETPLPGSEPLVPLGSQRHVQPCPPHPSLQALPRLPSVSACRADRNLTAPQPLPPPAWPSPLPTLGLVT